MKNNIVFRIIGAFASSLIILSIFMAFTNIESISLWDIYNNSKMLYMPIMIIVFGCIGVIFFSLNIKTEFAYATSGAMIFFSVTQLVQAIINNTVSTLGLGFYFVAVGGIMVGLMAFLCNIKHNNKVLSNETMPNTNSNEIYNSEIVNLKLENNNEEKNIIKPIINDNYNINNDNVNNLNQSIPEIVPTYNHSKPDVILDNNSLNTNDYNDKNITSYNIIKMKLKL